MTTAECPWCDAPAEVTATRLDCEACGVSADLADEHEALAAAA